MGSVTGVARWVDQLKDALAVVRAGDAPEGPHQMRVALERIRLWLRLAGIRVLRDDIRWLRRAAGPLRDLDVQLELALPAAVAAAEQRAAARSELLTQIDQPRTAALLTALERLPPATSGTVERNLRRLAARTLKAGDVASSRPDDDLPVQHALRRHVRRMRYALEFTSRDAGAFVDLQTSLGEVCDTAMARERSPGDSELSRQLARRQRDAGHAARQQWKTVRAQLEQFLQA